MKNIYVLFFFLISGFANAQIVNIPDANFKNALLNELVADFNGDGFPDSHADINNDGEIQISEAEAVLGLSVFSRSISSLEGLQNFINLKFLFCELNNISTINLAECQDLIFLQCYSNNIINLDLSQNPELQFIWCDSNQLTNLDLSVNLNLEIIRAEQNNIANIILPQSSSLEEIHLRQNQLTTIDISQNPNLIELNCGENLMPNIDVSQNENLEFLAVGGNLLNNIDVSNNTNLESFYCNGNQLSNLNVSQNLELIHLSCHRNELTNLDLSNNLNLRSLNCYENKFVALDLSENINLVSIESNSNPFLSYLNLKNGNNINMYRMFAFDNSQLPCIMVDDENATYPECFQFSGWCKDETAIYSEDCQLTTKDFATTDFKLFPNPAQNVLNIQSQEQIDSVRIFTLEGRLLLQTANPSIDISQLKVGLYLVQIMVQGHTATKIFLKN